MKKIFVSVFIILFSAVSYGQYVYTIKADSVKITNDSCNAELIIENSTKNVRGFLYNKGNGRTEFRKALIPVGTNKYIIGSDTLDLTAISPTNVIHTTGDETKSGVLTLSSNPILSSMTKGSIPFFGTGGKMNQDNARLFWDSATKQIEVTGTLAIKDGSDGMRWGYSSSSHFLSIYPLAYTGGPTGFWNVQTATAANQNRTNVVNHFSMGRGFMLGTLQDRTSNIVFDVSRYKPDVTTYDVGDVIFNAGHQYYFDAKPEVINYQKVKSSGATVSQWNATVGYTEYEATTTGTETFNTDVDYLSKGSTYDIHLFAIIRDPSTGVQSMWRENRVVTIGLSSLSPSTTFIAENQTIGTALKDTGISSASMTVSGTGAYSNYSYLIFTGVSGKTVSWKVQVKRIEL